MRADEVERLLVRDVLLPDEVIQRRYVEADHLRLVTHRRHVTVRPAPWAIAQATGVVDAVRVYVEHELPGADITYGYVWLADGRVLLLNNVEDLRELGRGLLSGVDPLAYAEILAELYTGPDIGGPVVMPLSARGHGQSGFLVRDARDFLAEHGYLPGDTVASPDVRQFHNRAGRNLVLTFYSYALVLREFGTAINVYAWRLQAVAGQLPTWTRERVVEMATVGERFKHGRPSVPVGDIVAAFDVLPQVRVSLLDDRVAVHVPAVADTAHVVAEDVVRFSRIQAPDGSPALEFVVGAGREVLPFIVTDTDIVYQPVSPDVVLDSLIPYHVEGMPHLVAYTEMMRDAELVGRDPARFRDHTGGTLLRTRCFIMGAARLGLRPLAAVWWWERTRAVAGDFADVPPWRDDLLWTELAEEAQLAHRRGELTRSWLQPQIDEAGAIARLSKLDFERLEPGLSVIGLDDELIDAWRRWIPISPATFHGTLLRGVADGVAELSFYPDGGGTVDLRVPLPSGRLAFMQFHFSYADRNLAIDEVRIPDGEGQGLFRRLMFNTEALGAQLGMAQLSVHATDVGAWAFATLHRYPRDYELQRNGRG